MGNKVLLLLDDDVNYLGQNAWTSLIIHYPRRSKFECESAHNKKTNAQNGQVALIKLALLLYKSHNLKT